VGKEKGIWSLRVGDGGKEEMRTRWRGEGLYRGGAESLGKRPEGLLAKLSLSLRKC
jgi:hypothetical protein